MRRDDEAFKNEVFRRYSIQKRNQRNFRLLATAPLIFCVVIVGVLLLPTILEMLKTTPVADDPSETTVKDAPDVIPEVHPLEQYLTLPISRISYRVNTMRSEAFECRNDAELDGVIAELLKLNVTEIDGVDASVVFDGAEITIIPTQVLVAYRDYSTRLTLRFSSSGYVELQYISYGTSETPAVYQVPAKEVAELTRYLEKLMESEPAHPLAGYLSRTISYIRWKESEDASSLYTYAADKEVQGVATELLKLHMTKVTGIVANDSGLKVTVYYPLSAYHGGSSRLLLSFDPAGYIGLDYYDSDMLSRTSYYQVPADEITVLTEYLKGLADEASTPPVDLPALSDFLAQGVDQISVYAQFGADLRYDVEDRNNWYASLIESLQACEFQNCASAVNATNIGEPTIVLTQGRYSLYLLLNDPNDSVIAYLYDSAGELLDTRHYITDNILSFGRTISWANTSMLSANPELTDASILREILAEEIKSTSYRLYALQDALFTCRNADEIQCILDCIEKMSFTERSAVNLTCMGSVVTFTLGDGRTATLSFDDTGYLHLLVKDAGGMTLTSQWYEFSLNSPYDDIHSCLGRILPKCNDGIYPTPGNLYTEVYPIAGILNLYPEYLASYIQPSDYENGEIMRRIHELQLTECTETPDYTFNQPVVELWFSDYVFRVIVDGEHGYIRTFVEEFDQTTLLEAKLYKGSVQEISALAAYLEKLNSASHIVWEELHVAPLDTFRAFLNQDVASIELSASSRSPLPFEYTDAKVISAVIAEINALPLINTGEEYSYTESPNSSYIYIEFANGNWMTLTFDSSGYVEYRFIDRQSEITYAGKYRLSAASVSAFAAFIDPYLDPPLSDDTPLMEDLLKNTALQNFLNAMGVTANTVPEEAPREIERLLADHGGSGGGFFAEGQSFASPDGVNLGYLLYDYSGIDRSPLSDAERLELVKAGVHPEFVNMDVSRFTLEEVRAILEDNLAYMPAFADDLHNELIKYTVYAPETDCYYQFHTDTLGSICGINARLYRTDRADTVIVLFSDYFYGDMHAAAFRIVDGAYRLYGYTPI